MKWLREQGPVVLMHALALLPLAWLVRDFASGDLTADPIREIQLRTGRYAIILLAVSLAGTPLYALFRAQWLRLLRRLSGLYAFSYASLHLLNFLWIDYGFNLLFLQEAVLEKPFVLTGLAAFLFLVPAAFTSTTGWQRRLGGRWRKLHRLVYLAAGLDAIHYIWQAKLDIRLPMIFTLMIAILLLLRLLPSVGRRE